MPTHNVHLTPEMIGFVEDMIRSGQYADANEVLRAGLCALEKDEQEDRARLEAVRSAVREGEESGIAEGDVFNELRDRIRRRALVTGRV